MLLTAFALPGLAGLEVARQVRERAPETKVVLFAAPLRESYLVEALRVKAAGYLLRSASPKELLRAIHETAAGRGYLSPPLSTRVVTARLEKAASQPAEPYDRLTRRERDVLRLATEGHSNARIADQLGISRRTAGTNRANLLGKLSLENQTELILYALRTGVLPLGLRRFAQEAQARQLALAPVLYGAMMGISTHRLRLIAGLVSIPHRRPGAVIGYRVDSESDMGAQTTPRPSWLPPGWNT